MPDNYIQASINRVLDEDLLAHEENHRMLDSNFNEINFSLFPSLRLNAPEQNTAHFKAVFIRLAIEAVNTLGEDEISPSPENDGEPVYHKPYDLNTYQPKHPYPSLSVLRKYPSVDPEGVYSDMDAQITWRLDRLVKRRPYMSDATRDAADLLLAEPYSDSVKQALKDFEIHGIQMRRLDRMIEICGDDPRMAEMKENLTQTRANMLNSANFTPAMKQLVNSITCLEMSSGLITTRQFSAQEKTEMEDSLVRMANLGTRLPAQPRPIKLGVDRGFSDLQRDQKVETFDMKHLLTAVSFNFTHNWGAPKEQWGDLNAAVNDHTHPLHGMCDLLTANYGIGVARDVLGNALPAPSPEEGGVMRNNPLDLVIVGGVPARELMQNGINTYATRLLRTREQEPTEDAMEDAIAEVVSNPRYCHDLAAMAMALGMQQKLPVTVLKIDPAANLVDVADAAHFTLSDDAYRPSEFIPGDRPVISLWQRFAHWAFGAYQKEFDKLERYDLQNNQMERVAEIAEARSELNAAIAADVKERKEGNEAVLRKADEQKAFQQRLEMVYGYPPPSDALKNANPLQTNLRGNCVIANQPFNMEEADVETDEYAALTEAFFHHPSVEGQLYPENERAMKLGVIISHSFQDVQCSRPGVNEMIRPEVVDMAHQLTRALLTGEPGQEAYDDAKTKLMEVLPFMVSSAVRGRFGMTDNHLPLLRSVATLGTFLEERGLLEDAPQNVKDGFKTASALLSIHNKAELARQKLTGLPAPTPAEAKEYMLDVMMERHMSAAMLAEFDSADERALVNDEEYAAAKREADNIDSYFAEVAARAKAETDPERKRAIEEEGREHGKQIVLNAAVKRAQSPAKEPLTNNILAFGNAQAVAQMRENLKTTRQFKDIRQQVINGTTTYVKEVVKTFHTNYSGQFQPKEYWDNIHTEIDAPSNVLAKVNRQAVRQAGGHGMG